VLSLYAQSFSYLPRAVASDGSNVFWTYAYCSGSYFYGIGVRKFSLNGSTFTDISRSMPNLQIYSEPTDAAGIPIDPTARAH
jgi:hypothetical protein